ncbi:HD domain-containing protein [Mucilaginibacter pedocola]|uniref:HD domain-containing protein n=1 Tax=Mucilaginibacter pedocola TaxID=1792845 RepID=A0A1S9P8P8_9SPHI|nr:HD domain-containing protein [Mucilaginibacter pedocola]OOQ57344.1 hypothetical protein BC343_14660 [Mucilaginibacter pedocola]
MTELIKSAEVFVAKMLESQLPAGMCYHNIEHTRFVVAALTEICKGANLPQTDRDKLTLAGWFHDTGYCYSYIGHESISMTIAGDFMRTQNCSDNLIKSVRDCIRATQMPQNPKTELEAAMCDADMAHLSSPEYFDHAALLRQEWASRLQKTYTDDEWQHLNLKHMADHTYFTDFALANWQERKHRNLKMLRMALNE